MKRIALLALPLAAAVAFTSGATAAANPIWTFTYLAPGTRSNAT